MGSRESPGRTRLYRESWLGSREPPGRTGVQRVGWVLENFQVEPEYIARELVGFKGTCG